MFKKLKEKITEEVKSSPQRFQQLTQSVSDRLQQQQQPNNENSSPNNNDSTADENFFSIGGDEDETGNSSSGFLDVSLVAAAASPMEVRNGRGERRTSTSSSIASDVSFLPRYESSLNSYQLQSDLDISASEVEDNTSQLGQQQMNLSKAQIYSAFQKSQQRYHKYRGRYTDLARHYKALERENAKMKSVLGDTQDKAIRRVSELKEQCGLEQKAKAHLEAALRDELDEKTLKIESLEQKISLLQQQPPAEHFENLSKYLTEAREEIETLNSRLQEMKANAIVFQAKETDYRNRISVLEKEFEERERETNLNLAQSKMELHNEILSKDAEISTLKQEAQQLRQTLDNANSNNLQAQNLKLIEKLEMATQKCNQYESELLKVQQLEIQVRESDEKLEQCREDAKKSLLSLESKVRAQISLEFQEKHEEMERKFKEKLEAAGENSSKIFEREQQLENAEKSLASANADLKIQLERYSDLEKNHLELIEDSQGLRNTISILEKELNRLQQSRETEMSSILEKSENSHRELQAVQEEFRETAERNLQLEKSKSDLEHTVRLLEEKLQVLELDKNESKLLEMKLDKLEEEKRNLTESFEKERLVFEALLADNEKLKEAQDYISDLEHKIHDFESTISQLQHTIQAFELELSETNQLKLELEKTTNKLEEKVRIFEEKDEAVELEKTESKLLEMKLQQLEDQKKTLIENFEAETDILHRKIAEKDAEIERDTEKWQQILKQKETEIVTELQQLLQEFNIVYVDSSDNLDIRNQLQVFRAGIEQKCGASSEENATLKKELDKQKEELENVRGELLVLEERSVRMSSDNSNLREENSHLETQIQEFQLQIATLVQDLEIARKDHSQKMTESERHFNEIAAEKQLLLDEIQELKSVPAVQEDLEMFKTENQVLRDKVTQYKSLDLTNKTSIDFYETELQKFKNQNEKLARKLDETLVTLNHCAELSSSTEIEYLRNVLYNYMLGKESLVLARVIAAVCKFDQEQTDTVLAREQQKQGLLAQLGIL